MSIVFYGFRSKDRIHFAKQVRFIRKFAKNLVAPEGIDVQYFETSEGLVFRVLEWGYGIKNKLWNKPKYFPSCSYDDRADEPKGGYSASIDLINEIDNLISSKKYKTITIVPEWEKNERHR